MKLKFLRRLGALTLALAMALSVSIVPAMADGTDATVTISGADSLNLKVGGGSGTLTADMSGLPATDVSNITYQWTAGTPQGESGSVTLANDTQQTVTVTPTAAGKVQITVEVKYQVDTSDTETGGGDAAPRTVEEKTATATATLTIAAADPLKPTITAIELNKTTLELEIGEEEQLSIIKTPADGIMLDAEWRSSLPSIASVDENGKVTALRTGTTVISVTTMAANGTSLTRSCTVNVGDGTVPATSVTIPRDTLQIEPTTTNLITRQTVTVGPDNSTDTVKWASSDESVVKAEADTANGRTGRLTWVGPGRAIVTAQAVDKDGNPRDGVMDTMEVVVSGIVIEPSAVTLTEGQSATLVCKAYGGAETNGVTPTWTSSDPSVASVNSGRINTYKAGTVTITATKGNYPSATCTITVAEDRSAIVEQDVSAGMPYPMYNLYQALNAICISKTEVRDANNNLVTAGRPLSYITSLSVSPSQGVLYYNYSSAANTGDGVGIGDKFYPTATTGQKSLSDLTFVPNRSFVGTAEIQYSGWAGTESFSGIIRLNVGGSGATTQTGIYYDTIAGQPADFQGADFDAFCRNRNGRSLSYVVFTLPSASYGTLYYNYTGQSAYANKVTSGTKYYLSGSTSISGVSFVPALGAPSQVNISYRAYDTSGSSYTGTVTVYVSSSSTVGDVSDVYITAQQGQEAAFTASRFNDACLATLGETLSYVRFSLPASSEGTLYYNYRSAGVYESRVDTNTRYYYSGTPGIGSITFVPAANAPAQIVIPYTGYGVSGSTFTGNVRIGSALVTQGTINYSVARNGQVAFQVTDFNTVCLQQTGYSMSNVRFSSLPTSLGVLYHNYRSNISNNVRVSVNTPYYRTTGYANQLGNISFVATSGTGTVTIPYYGQSTTGTSFSGSVVIQVGATTPADINLSGTTSSQVWLPSASIRSACTAVTGAELTYIVITSLPSEKEGRVYSGYNGIGTGTEVKTGTKYYRAGSPSIDQLSFVPYGGFNGTATITYIGYSSNGLNQVSGQIKISIANSTKSQYFNDMSNHAWAADAVDFLYVNDISNGVGGGRYAPSATLSRGDFTLMLVRTFGFTSSSVVRFSDVPTSSYYAGAISTAKALGISVGESGNYFYPKQAISRQDAMVMLYNALKASGKTLTNGLAADLSGFSDRDSIASYARNAVGTLVQMGVVKGDGNGRLRPTGTLTRAETAILLQYVLTL